MRRTSGSAGADSTALAWLARYVPPPTNVSKTEQVRASVGALLGVLLTGAVSSWVVGVDVALPLLIAPMGASAVLLFAVPASPLAQPWSIIGGNLVAALCGVTAAHVIAQPLVAAAIAIGAAIAIMIALRCVHPPSGAVALTAVLGGPAITVLGYRFVLWPVLLNSAVIVLTAIAYNNATRRKYPQVRAAPTASAHGTRDEAPSRRLSFSSEDFDAVMKRYDQVLDISREDMEGLFREAELTAYKRRFGIITCADVMSRDVVAVEWGTPLQDAWTIMRRRGLRAMPVLDKARRVEGIVHDTDFMNDAGLDTYHDLAAKLHRLIRPPQSDYTDRPEVVGQIMTKGIATVRTDTHIAALVPHLADGGARYVPIVDMDDKLAGIIAQSDLIAALYRSRLMEQPAA